MTILLNCDIEIGRNREKVNNIKHIVPPTPQKNKELPQYGHQFCYGEKLPMAWDVPQQTDKLQKSIPSQYAREIQHLKLKDLETYLIPDGCSRSPLSFFQSLLC